MNIVQKEPEIHDDGIGNIIYDLNAPKESKVVLWDADSVVHFVLYSGKDEITGERNPEYTEEDLEMLQGKLTEFVLKTLNSVEKYFNILALYIFIKGKNNFRKQLYPQYDLASFELTLLSYLRFQFEISLLFYL